jgi:DNA polymerase III subunit gamma/tau
MQEDTSTYKATSQRYRPQLFSQVCHQAPIIETMKNAIAKEKLGHAYLFSGARGTGKTSLARLFAKAINCTNRGSDGEPCNTCHACKEMLKGSSLDFLEMDAASSRGIDDIRTLLETVSYKPSVLSKKIYLIDEVHMLTKEAFNALLKTLEEPPAHVLFFLATTERHKLPATIVSRCQRFELGKIPAPIIKEKLASILQDFSVTAEEGALELIAEHAEGSLRDAQSILDQMLCLCSETITAGDVEVALGLPKQTLFFQIDAAIASDDKAFAFSFVETMHSQGLHLSHFLKALASHYRTLCKRYLVKPAQPVDTVNVPSNVDEAVALYEKEHLFNCLDLVTKKLNFFVGHAITALDIEVLLLEMIRSKYERTNSYLVKQLIDLKAALENSPSSTSKKPETPPLQPQVETTEKAADPTPVIKSPAPVVEPIKSMDPPASITAPPNPSPPLPQTSYAPKEQIAMDMDTSAPPKAALEPITAIAPSQEAQTPPSVSESTKSPKNEAKEPETGAATTTLGVKEKALQEQKLWFAAVELSGNLSKE